MTSTNSIQPFPVVGVQDPRQNLNANSDQKYVIIKGSPTVSVQRYSTNSYSNSSAQIVIQPPSKNTILDLNILQQFSFTVTCTGDARASNNGLGFSLSLRCFPIASITDTNRIILNNASLNVNLADIIHPLMKYGYNKCKYDKCLSMTPSQPDQYQVYSDFLSPIYGGDQRNPMGTYGESENTSRGAFQPDSVVYDAKSNTTTIVYTVVEPMFLQPPFLDDPERLHMGLYNVNQIQVDVNFRSNLNRILSWSPDAIGAPALSNFQVNISSPPSWHVTFLSKSLIMPSLSSSTYPYYQLNRFVSTGATLTAGSSTQSNSNNVQLSQYPKLIYVFVRDTNTDINNPTTGLTVTDSFASITSVSVDFDNKTALLANYNQFDLYRMCLRNGTSQSWPQFKQFQGSVICIAPVFDFGLDPLAATGVGAQINLKILVNYTNPSSITKNYDLYVVICNDGLLNISSDDNVMLNTSVVTPEAALESSNAPQIPIDQATLEGGSAFGKLKSVISGIGKVGRVVGSVGQAIAPQAAPVFSTIEKLSDLAIKETGGVLSGGRMRRRRTRKTGRRARYGGDLIGGELSYDL